MDITLEPKELLLLIERFSDKSIVLSTKTIYLYINEQRYVCFANNLTVKQLNELCYELAKDLAIQEGYKEDIDAIVTFNNIRITKHIILNDKSSSDRKFTYFMDDNIEDVRQEEQEEEINEYYDELLEQEYTYDNERNLIDNTVKDNEIEAIYDDMFEEQERRELEDLEQYEEQVHESDEINHKIQAEMEQYIFENGENYEDYQEPQSYDTEEDLVDNPAKDDEPVDIDELNNDLDEALK